MSPVIVIAKNVLTESVRRKNLYVLAILSAASMALFSLLSFFDLGVQQKFLEDLCLAILSLFGTLLAVFVAADQLPKEAENKTLYHLLTRPLSRFQLLLGKWLGVLIVVALNLFVLGGVFIFILFSKGFSIKIGLFDAIYLLFMQSVFMASLSILFSLFLTRGANILLCVILYGMGHVKSNYLNYLISRSESNTEKTIYQTLYYLFPNLENFNVKFLLLAETTISFTYMIEATLYALLFSLAFLLLAAGLFYRKEF